MYSFSGQLSQLAHDVQAALGDTDVTTDPERDDSYTLIVFRIDPVDQ